MNREGAETFLRLLAEEELLQYHAGLSEAETAAACSRRDGRLRFGSHYRFTGSDGQSSTRAHASTSSR